MKKPLILVMAFFLPVFIYAQEVISTVGEVFSVSSSSISYTLGELVINTENSGTVEITQGFQQSNWIYVGMENYAPDFQVAIFPNPISNELNIRVANFENVSYQMFDATGKLVKQNILTGEITVVDVQQFATGMYTITLLKGNQDFLKTIKLIKHR